MCFAHQDGVNALDKNWHREHFVCAECGCGFDDGVYFSKDADDGRGERPYCEADFMELFVPKVGKVSRWGLPRIESPLAHSLYHSTSVTSATCL